MKTKLAFLAGMAALMLHANAASAPVSVTGAHVAIVVTKNVGGQVTNVATVSAVEADPNNANNSNSVDTTPAQLLGFEVD